MREPGLPRGRGSHPATGWFGNRVDVGGTIDPVGDAPVSMPFPADTRLVISSVSTSPLPPQRAPRLDSLTGLRWWAAFGVFAHHMSNLAPLPIAGPLALGNYGVMFFFVLSGFVLTWSANTSVSAPTFWWRRFARIYPAHFVALLVAIPVFYSLAPDPADWWVKPVDVGILVLSVFLLQGWSRDPVVLFSGNPAAWTLTCEAFFYSLHPAINRVLRGLTLRRTFAAAGALIAAGFGYRALTVLFPETFGVPLPFPVARLSEFVLGMCAAHAIRIGWRPRLAPVAIYLLGAVFLAWLVLSPSRLPGGVVGAGIRASANEWILLLCLLLIVAVAARDLTRGRSLLRSLPLVKLGEWSYCFYLVHATAIYLVLAQVGQRAAGWGNLAWYALMLVVSILLAAALHYGVEKPAERAMRAWWDRRLARRAARVESSAGAVSPPA